jgi:ribonuclease HI
MNLDIFCDGAYSSSRDSGGIGLVLLEDGKELIHYSNMYKRTSNNQMELGALIIALRLVKKEYNSITIYSDSQYVIGCASQGWSRKKNVKLWKEYEKQFDRVSTLCKDIKFIHVRGHQTDNSFETKWNNYVDNLAQKASELI